LLVKFTVGLVKRRPTFQSAFSHPAFPGPSSYFSPLFRCCLPNFFVSHCSSYTFTRQFWFLSTYFYPDVFFPTTSRNPTVVPFLFFPSIFDSYVKNAKSSLFLGVFVFFFFPLFLSPFLHPPELYVSFEPLKLVFWATFRPVPFPLEVPGRSFLLFLASDPR